MISLANTVTRNAYYRIGRSGRVVSIKFGRIGTAGKVMKKTLRDKAEAKAFVNSKLVEKLSGGYERVSAVVYYGMKA